MSEGPQRLGEPPQAPRRCGPAGLAPLLQGVQAEVHEVRSLTADREAVEEPTHHRDGILRHHAQPESGAGAIDRIVAYYNHERLHEALGNLTPDDMYHGRQRTILSRWEKGKRLTLELRKKEDLRDAA